MTDFPNPYEESREESQGEEDQRLAGFLVMVLRNIGLELEPDEWDQLRDKIAKFIIRWS